MDGLADVKRLVVVHSPCSTRAKRYGYIYAELTDLAVARRWQVTEIELDDVPYLEAVKLVAKQLLDGDLVVAAGGDGVAQVTFNAVYSARVQAIFATIPLGNGNDISRAFNGKHHSVTAIMGQSVRDFYPLNVVIDNRLSLAVASYITFGATTVLVDYLNNQSSRRMRRMLKHLSPAAALPVGHLGQISRTINQLDFPDFHRGSELMTDDSIGFFLISAAHNVLRLPKEVTMASSEFFFHHAVTKDKNLMQKVLMAGTWTVRFPGDMTELEELRFVDHGKDGRADVTDASDDLGRSNCDIVANISGDNVNLGKVTTISAIRSPRSIRILCGK